MASSSEQPSLQAANGEEHPLYKGSCHCGAIAYTVRVNLKTPDPRTGKVLIRCNCSSCHKGGVLGATAEPRSSLTLTSGGPLPASLNGGEKSEAGGLIVDYTYGTGQVHHYFCAKCGTRCFYGGTVNFGGGTPFSFTRINALTLDEKADGSPIEDLRKLSVGYWDGKGDGWAKGVSDEPYDGGYW